MKSITESIIGKRGNTGGLKGILQEFDIVTCRELGGPYLVIFDKDIIDHFIFLHRKEAYPGLLLKNSDTFMYLSRYTDNLFLDEGYGQFNYSPYDIVEVYRNSFLDHKIFKRDIMSGKHDKDLDANSILRTFRGHNIYEKIWERK